MFSYYIRLTSLFLFWASLVDRLGATSFALGSGGFDHGCETGWKVGAATSLAVVRGLRPGAFLAGAWRTGAKMPLAGSLSGTQASVAWRVIGADGPFSLVS